MQSSKHRLSSVGLVFALAAAPSAWADHNSPWGEGWANMPNDTHDTRIETLDDNDAFLDYVGNRDAGGGIDRVDVGRITVDRPDVARGGPER
ncbi:MAG: hypothetical protein P8076_04930 [Gammaproteobacteria bacterium]